MTKIIVRDSILRDRAADLVRSLSLEGKPWVVTVERQKRRRSLSQSNLMWMWISEVAGHVSEATGYDENEIHVFFKNKFLPPKIIEINGEEVEYRTTTTLTTKEMSEYMDRIYRWATSELGLFLPVPELQGSEVKP